jgi:hypothetical protein
MEMDVESPAVGMRAIAVALRPDSVVSPVRVVHRVVLGEVLKIPQEFVSGSVEPVGPNGVFPEVAAPASLDPVLVMGVSDRCPPKRRRRDERDGSSCGSED